MNRNSILFKIKNTKIYNSLFLVLRNLRTKRGVQNYKKNFSFKFNKSSILLYLLILALLGAILFNISKYSQLSFSPYLDASELETRPLILEDSKEINTLFIGFDDTQNSYKFINMIAIISLDYQTASIKTYTLNPNYIVNINGNKVTLRAAFNVLTSQSSEKMNDVQKLIENLSAIRIDRYIAFNYSELPNLLALTDLSVESDESYKLGDNFITEGEVIRGDKLNAFVTFDNNPDDKALKRQSMFLKEFLENLRDKFALYKYFLNSKEFSQVIHTNLNKDEFIRFIINISSTDTTILNDFASEKLTLKDLSKLNREEGIEHSAMLLDEDVSQLFRNISIIKEQAKLEIFNATETSGVAYNLKRKFENSGITVIKTGNYPDIVSENILYIPKNNPDYFLNTIRFIRSILRDNVKVVYGDYKFNYSGDMILVIGKI